MSTMSRTPTTVVIICVTVFSVVVIGCLTILAFFGKDPVEISRLINTLLNIAALVLSGGSLLYAGTAAHRSGEAANNTNGLLTETVTTAVNDAIDRR